jgi:glycosyltransferase involved in cell wall biosynthesis
MQAADAFVLSSVGLGEAGPISVMEAMSTALPVICSVIGATPVMVRDGESGLLVEQEDIDGLADAMTRLAADPDLRKRIGTQARRHAVDHFDSRRTGLRLLEWIERTSGKRFRP